MKKVNLKASSIQWLIPLSVLTVLPHINNLSAVFISFFILLAGWRYLGIKTAQWLPKPWLLFACTLFGIIVAFLEAGTLFGQTASVSLLITMFALKLLELKTERDFYLLIFLSFFTILTHFIFDQSLFLAGYLFLVTFALVTLLIFHNLGSGFQLNAVKLTTKLFLQAFPVMVILFLFFPRISSPLWSLPDDSSATSGGLSPIMEPGSIGRLSLSDKTAFRVTFEGKLPPTTQRYWRSQVFWKTTDNGRRWELASLGRNQNSSAAIFYGDSVHYTINLEPHQQQRLVALDLPSQSTHLGKINSDYLLISTNKLSNALRYSVSSAVTYNTGGLSAQERTLGLQLPKDISPKISALVSNWKSQSDSPDQIIQQALHYFRNKPFSYTLNPPKLLGHRPLETFLFESRQGFCEHYATAFVYLMRAAGIPSRIVAGYQGGEYNDIGDFLEVRQADAHAWSEVWLKNSGWVRIDPTAAVAPERVELGIDLRNQLSSREVQFAFNPPAGFIKFGLTLRHLFDSLDYRWQTWVLGYSFEKQLRLLSKLGFSGLLNELLSILVVACTLALAFVAFFILRPQKGNHDKVAQLYIYYCKKLATKNISRYPSETASALSKRAMERLPALQKEIQLITETYQQLRYEESCNPNDLLFLQQLIRRFHP